MTEDEQKMEYRHAFSDIECMKVAMLHHKHDFLLSTSPEGVGNRVLKQRQAFIQSEVKEMLVAIEENNILDVIDALVDIVYVAKGTAVMMGIPWGKHFDEVHRANMEKVKGKNPERPDQDEDLIKPESWQEPDHLAVLRGED